MIGLPVSLNQRIAVTVICSLRLDRGENHQLLWVFDRQPFQQRRIK
jgi:hypothetical protein